MKCTFKRKPNHSHHSRKTHKKGGKTFECNEEEYEKRLLQQLKHIQTTIQEKSTVTKKQVKKMMDILESCKAHLDKPILLQTKTKAMPIWEIFADKTVIPDKTVRKQLSDLYDSIQTSIPNYMDQSMYIDPPLPEYYIPGNYSTPSDDDEPPPLITGSHLLSSKIILPISVETPRPTVDYSAIRIPLPFHRENSVLLEYWLHLFNGNGKRDQYNMQSLYDLKTDILHIINTPVLCEAIVKLIRNYNTSETTSHYQNIYCVVFMIISIMSKLLNKNEIATVLIKGGKALQMYSKIVSDDIDVLIIPKNDMTDKEITEIGKKMSDFISWLTAEPREVLPIIGGNEICSSTKRSHCAHIIKCVYTVEEGNFAAILDIGLGYNHLDEYIKELVKKNTRINFYKYMVVYPSLQSIVQEKIYYILLYLYDNHLSANRYFRNRAMISLLIIIKSRPKKLFATIANTQSTLKKMIHSAYVEMVKKFNRDGYPTHFNSHNMEVLHPMISELFYGNADHWICTSKTATTQYKRLFTNNGMVEAKTKHPLLQFELIFDSEIYNKQYTRPQYSQTYGFDRASVYQNEEFPPVNYSR